MISFCICYLIFLTDYPVYAVVGVIAWTLLLVILFITCHRVFVKRVREYLEHINVNKCKQQGKEWKTDFRGEFLICSNILNDRINV